MSRSPLMRWGAGELLKDSSVLFMGMATIHVCNLLFQIVMGRCLAEDEFAVLIALLGMFNVLVVPLGVVSSTVNRYTSLLIQEERHGDIRRLIFYWLRIVSIPGGVLAICCIIFPERIASFVHLERSAPMVVFGLIVAGAFIRPVLDGALLGLQHFKGWSISSSVGWGCRLVVGGLLVIVVSPYAGWGLLGHGIGFYGAIALGALFLGMALKEYRATDQPLPSMHGFVFASFFILLGFSCLMTADVVLVKHLFPDKAGDFAYAATLGRLVIFIPQALVASMFPKVVSEGMGSKLQVQIFIRTCLVTLLATIASAFLFSFICGFALRLIYNIAVPSNQLMLWCRVLAWIMVPISLLSVTVRFALAQKKYKIVSVLPVAAICYVFASFNAVDVGALLWSLSICSVGALGVCWVGLLGFFKQVYVLDRDKESLVQE